MWFIPYLESKGDAQLFTKVRQGAHICTVAVYLTPNHAFLLRKGARACSTSLLPPEHTHQFSSWLYNTQLGQSNFTEKKTCGDTNWNPVATNSLAPPGTEHPPHAASRRPSAILCSPQPRSPFSAALPAAGAFPSCRRLCRPAANQGAGGGKTAPSSPHLVEGGRHYSFVWGLWSLVH